MNQPQESVRLSFECEIDERAEWEIRQKGYFEHGSVNLPDGKTVRVFFGIPLAYHKTWKQTCRRVKHVWPSQE